METLRDRINSAKQQQEDQQRAENPYQTAMSPNGVGTENPDVAKMAGTPNQKQSTMDSITEVVTTPESPPPQQSTVEMAQQQAAPQPDDLTEAQQMPRDFEAEATTERAKSWSEAMTGFGSLGGRVEQLIMSQMTGDQLQEGQTAVGQAEFELNDQMVSQFAAPGQEEAVAQAFQSFNSAQTPEAAFEALASVSSSFANPSAAIVDILGQAYRNDPEAQNQMVANAISQNIIDPDEITIDQLVQGGMLSIDESGTITELGMTEQQVQELLGENWASLTPAQIEQQLAQFQDENLANREKILEQLADPTLDPSARAGLVEELRVMGATGEIDAEQVAEESRQIAADSGMLVIGGEVQDVGDLLQDENIQEDVKNYLMDGEMSEEWARENPEFAQWIDREMEDMRGQSQQLENRLEQFGEIQKENESFVENNLADSADGKKLADDVMSALGFSTEGFQAGQFDPATSELYSALQEVGDKGTLGSVVDAMNGIPDEALEELKGEFLTSPEGAKELVGILSDPSMREDMVKALQLPAKLETMSKPDDMVRAVTGRGLEEVQSAMNKLRLNSLIGDPKSQQQYNLLKSIFGADGSGQISGDPAAVSGAIKNFIGSEGAGGLESLMKGNLGKLGETFDSSNNVNYRGGSKELHKSIAEYGNDGEIDNEDLIALRKSMNGSPDLGVATMSQIRNNPQLMQQLGINKNTLSQQIKELSNIKIANITGGLIGTGKEGEKFSLLRPGEDPAVAMNTSSADWFDARNKLEEAYKTASSPEEKSAIMQAVQQLRKATSKKYINNWGTELAVSKDIGRYHSNMTLNQINKYFPDFPKDQISKAFTSGPGGYTLKSARTPEAQNFVAYFLAAQDRLKSKGQDLGAELRKGR